MSQLPTFTIREMLEAGVHFGHRTRRWNPKMQQYIYGTKNDIHILDLQQTVPLLYNALTIVRNVVSRNGRVLFVGTKGQAAEIVAEEAKRCGQHFINHRWLGGTLTNWSTISHSIRTLKKLDETLAAENTGLTKKETLDLSRRKEKLERSIGGVKEMGGLPDILFVIDTNKEELAVSEAVKLGVPIVAILDSNSNPDGITYPVPGNDDSIRAIKFYCRMFSDAVLSGIQASLSASGVDLGAAAEAKAQLPEEANDNSGKKEKTGTE